MTLRITVQGSFLGGTRGNAVTIVYKLTERIWEWRFHC